MYFISDLDKTIIYSKQPDAVCVEYNGDRPITYMTKKARNIMNDLITSFIPCTLRSIEQTLRIDFTQKLKYLICDNGASIYIDGVADANWDNYIDSILDRNKVKTLYNTLNNYIKKNDIPISTLKTNRDAFVSLIFKDSEIAEQYIDELLSFVDDYYNVFKQGKKTYVVPKNLNKSIAVKYLKETYNINNIITSGDSSVDDKFVELGDYQVIPQHAVFRTDGAIVTKNTGILAGEEILTIVKKIIEKQ